ncbi:MAG: T9SS type A sorting domain-containing protein [Flavobacteriales bacterium]|nr:T9SS type A sorting domain-containing protein [Flavobacteriales bacterium]
MELHKSSISPIDSVYFFTHQNNTHYMRITFILVLLCSFSIVKAQVGYQTHKFEITKSITVDPKEIRETFSPRVTHLEAPLPGGKSYKSYLRRAKEKLASEHPIQIPMENAARANVDPPNLVKGMGLTWVTGANTTIVHDGGTPNDNSFAISNDGFLLTAWNSSIYAHDLNADTAVLWSNKFYNAISFSSFAQGITVHSNFDPKILFDPIENKFVLLFLSVDRSSVATRNSTSKTVIGFSTTSNPSDPWNLYEISGNPLNNQTWSDYPAIAFTKDELFFTINLLTGDDWINDFQRTVVWQIDKKSGFRGDANLTTQLWDSITYQGKFLRYFRPIQTGAGPAGPNMYFVSNVGIPVDWGDTLIHSSDSIWLIEVDNTIASGSAKLHVKGGKANLRYHTPPDARQADGHTLFSNDARVLGGFYHGGQIQIVGTTRDTTTNRTGVYHGIISNLNGPINVNMHVIGDPKLDLGFPNIAYTGIKSNAHSSIIGFDHSSPTDFAGHSAVYYNGSGGYSKVEILKRGDNYVDLLTDGSGDRTYERWGDYFGIQRVYNDPKHVWMAGYYGKTDKRPGIWLSKVKAPEDINDPDTVGQGPPVAIQENTSVSKSNVFPNPANFKVNIEFEMNQDGLVAFQIVDVQGKVVKELIKTPVKQGKNEFSFFIIDLQPGWYFVRATSEHELVFNEKFVRSE